MLQEHLQAATTRKWQVGAEVQQAWSIFEAVVRGKLSPGGLMFLDLEYDTTTRRVYEVGMCDAWGNKVVDCFTYLSDEEMKRTTRGLQPYLSAKVQPPQQKGREEAPAFPWHDGCPSIG